MPHLTIPISAQDHVQGLMEAPVTLVEYGDYQCSSCKLFNSIIKQIQKQLGSKLCYVFRHFPLKQAHPLALMAAQTAEAAGMQNKFWDMHDTLYAHQQNLNPESMITLAEQLKLDISVFEADLQDSALIKKIEDDFRSGVRSGVNGTPCFFINGERYDGDRSYDSFLDALRQADVKKFYQEEI